MRSRFPGNMSGIVLTYREQHRQSEAQSFAALQQNHFRPLGWDSRPFMFHRELAWPGSAAYSRSCSGGPCMASGGLHQTEVSPECHQLLQPGARAVRRAGSCSLDGRPGDSQRVGGNCQAAWEELRAHSQTLGCATRGCQGPWEPSAEGVRVAQRQRPSMPLGPHVPLSAQQL